MVRPEGQAQEDDERGEIQIGAGTANDEAGPLEHNPGGAHARAAGDEAEARRSANHDERADEDAQYR